MKPRIFFAFLIALFLAGGARQLQAQPPGCAASPLSLREPGFETGVRVYSPPGAAGKLVLILGPTGGATRIEHSYARALCAKGIKAVVIDRWTDDQEYNLELEIHERIYRRAQRAVDLVLANFREPAVGILGTSLGATHAAVAAKRLERLSSAFLIVGGAPIASILATSEQPVLAEGKALRFRRYGFRSVEEYEAALRKVVPFEPLEMERKGAAAKWGMMISLSDTVVPTGFQQKLRAQLAPELVLESGFGHLGTILFTWLCRSGRVVDFFVNSL